MEQAIVDDILDVMSSSQRFTIQCIVKEYLKAQNVELDTQQTLVLSEAIERYLLGNGMIKEAGSVKLYNLWRAVNAENLRSVMEVYFPDSPRSAIEQYNKISEAIEPFLEKFNYNPITMRDVEAFCKQAQRLLPEAAKVCSYEKNKDIRNTHQAHLLKVIIEANYREWSGNYAKDFENMAKRLRYLQRN